MSDFKAKMHHIVCRLGLRPRSRWGSLQRSIPQTPLLDFRGLLLREGRGGDPLLSRYTPSHYILDKGLFKPLTSLDLALRARNQCLYTAAEVTQHSPDVSEVFARRRLRRRRRSRDWCTRNSRRCDSTSSGRDEPVRPPDSS